MSAGVKIDEERLAKLESLVLKHGSHSTSEAGMCAMEAAAWIAGEKHSDQPKCVSPVIAAFMRSWNDSLDDATRQKLKPYVARSVGTRASKQLELVLAAAESPPFTRRRLEVERDQAIARADRADGQFRALALEHNTLKAQHRQALLELEDLRAARDRSR